MGPQIGAFVRNLHEANGVVFHLEDSVVRIEGSKCILKSGAAVDADFLVLGVGVRPSLELAEQAGLKVDRGVVVDEYLQTSVQGIFAAGDIARWPDPHSGQLVRIEHWVVAERQGQVAAQNMLGRRQRFTKPPFFWTQQYDVSIRYVGHAQAWDSAEVEGSIERKEFAVTYKLRGRTLAVATVSRDGRSLCAEALMEAGLNMPS
jgi:NADPH-dependent 2,4-dienoyl-CoA reductase/sulfur reductase-like enzyme